MTRAELRTALSSYTTGFPEEQPFIDRFLQLLEQPRCFHRDHLPGHITGSAWIVNPERTRTLMVHHGFLKRWLQPGGHADGEEDVFNVALREAQEETGVTRFDFPTKSFFDIDIHPIPARNDFPAHDHYDIRFLLEASDTEAIAISDESTDLKWIDLDKLHHYTTETSVLRLRTKALKR